jgi:hypothetical protein
VVCGGHPVDFGLVWSTRLALCVGMGLGTEWNSGSLFFRVVDLVALRGSERT